MANRAECRHKLIDLSEEFVVDRFSVRPSNPLNGSTDGKDVHEAEVRKERHGPDGETFQSRLIVAGNEFRTNVQ